MNVQVFLDGLDELFQKKKTEEAQQWLSAHHEEAKRQGDLEGFLAVLNEEIGFYRSVSRHQEACRAFEQAMELMGILDLREGPAYATTLLNGATAYRAAGDYEKALQLYRKAEEAYEAAGVSGTYENAGLYNNMSILCANVGKRDAAAEYLKKAQKIIEQLPGCEAEAATTHTNLGLLYLDMKELEKAMEELKEARRLFEELPGAEDAHYGAALGGLAQAYCQAGEYESSIALYEKAMEAVERSFGRNEDYRILSENCALVCELAGKEKPAGKLPGQKVHQKGMDVSRAYYEAVGRDMLRENFPEYYERMTIGLVGYGSECFGFDDALSTDHDFGPAFCIFMDEEDVLAAGSRIQEAYDRLPKEFMGIPARVISQHGEGRVGVKSSQSFYREFLGIPRAPQTLYEWLRIPEPWMAAAVNGEIFKEGSGSFLKVRRTLQGYYPEDVRIKKIAARAALMAQSGQYNYSRLMMRKDYVGAALAVAEFLKAAGSMVYLLNRRYMPYYKWMYRGMGQLSVLSDVPEYMMELSRLQAPSQAWEDVSEAEYRYSLNTKDHRVVYIETICRRVREELKAQGLSSCTDAFLEYHTSEILSHMKDEELRSLHVLEG